MNGQRDVKFKNPEFDLRSIDATRYSLEAYGEQREPQTAFGLSLVQNLFASYPHLRTHAAWFRDALQPEDTLLVVDAPEHPFTVQIDPECEAIIISDPSVHIELGSWINDPEEEAFSTIVERYLNPDSRDV